MRIRFKNIYTKYIAIFMAIILLTVTILGVMVTTLLENYFLDSRKKELANLTISVETFLNKNGMEEANDLQTLLFDKKEALKNTLEIMFISTPNCSVLITDKIGNVLLCAYRDAQTQEVKIVNQSALVDTVDTVEKDVMPELVMEEILKERDISMRRDCEGFFKTNMILFASTLEKSVETQKQQPLLEDTTTEEGEIIGCVICFSQNSRKGEMISKVMRSIIIAVVWISIASLVAIYGVSYNVLKPLRGISEAAKSFSRGKFDVRVPVYSNDELGELAESFNEMAIALQAKDEMQKTFLSNASHDLRTPMTTIAGFIDGILDGAIPPEKQDYYLNIIKNEVQRLSRLVTSLLDLSRLQSGERKFEIKPFNICEVARQTVLGFEAEFEKKSLDVEFDLEEFDIMALGDKDAVNQVIYNLCHNAVKFSYERGKYRISVKKDGTRVRFSVFNEGVGISPEDLPFVFDRFYKSDKSRGLDKTGVGLGLFISKTIIEAHGEKLSVASEYQKNCEFSFTLPLAKKEEV